jgi:hypothetical protein
MKDSTFAWINDMENDKQQSKIRKFEGVYGDDGSTILPTSTWQATSARDGAQDKHFKYTQEC